MLAKAILVIDCLGKILDVIISLVFLGLIGWLLVKFLIAAWPFIWFILLFCGAAIVLLLWLGFLSATGLGIVLGVVTAIAGAWAFAKSRS